MFEKRKDGIQHKLKSLPGDARVCLITALEVSARSIQSKISIPRKVYQKISALDPNLGMKAVSQLLKKDVYEGIDSPEPTLQFRKCAMGEKKVFNQILECGKRHKLPIAVYLSPEHVGGIDYKKTSNNTVTVVSPEISPKGGQRLVSRTMNTESLLKIMATTSDKPNDENILIFDTVDRIKGR